MNERMSGDGRFTAKSAFIEKKEIENLIFQRAITNNSKGDAVAAVRGWKSNNKIFIVCIFFSSVCSALAPCLPFSPLCSPPTVQLLPFHDTFRAFRHPPFGSFSPIDVY
jgi:hypothetical protein